MCYLQSLSCAKEFSVAILENCLEETILAPGEAPGSMAFGEGFPWLSWGGLPAESPLPTLRRPRLTQPRTGLVHRNLLKERLHLVAVTSAYTERSALPRGFGNENFLGWGSSDGCRTYTLLVSGLYTLQRWDTWWKLYLNFKATTAVNGSNLNWKRKHWPHPPVGSWTTHMATVSFASPWGRDVHRQGPEVLNTEIEPFMGVCKPQLPSY